MLIDFRVKNFRSFAEEQTLSMVANTDDTLPENCHNIANFNLLKSVGIYGANASGKSNLLKAIGVMKTTVMESASDKPNKKKDITPFRLDKKLSIKPSEFEITFISDGVRYQYGFVAGETTIYEEWLFAYPKIQAQKWFHRKHNKKTNEVEIEFGPSLKGEKKKLKSMTRPDALFLSVGAQFGNTQLSEIYEWFNKKLMIIGDSWELRAHSYRYLTLAVGDNNKGVKRFLMSIFGDADLGISDIVSEQITADEIMENIPDGIPVGKKAELIEDMVKSKPLKLKTVHRITGSDDDVLFDFEDESTGTQRFLDLLVPWVHALLFGRTIVVDELESSLHPHLAKALIKMIHGKHVANDASQLIFATHDVTLLSQDLLRRDQVWFVEKDQKQASVLTPLTDYKPRKGEAILRGYMSGRYGAIPNLKEFEVK